MKRLLNNRQFKLLLAGQSLTMFGDVALFLVLGIWVKDLTGSDGAAGAVFFAISVPALVAPLGGVFVDRFSRRKVMLLNDLFMGVMILMLFFVRGEEDIWIIFGVALLYGASQQVFFAARSGLLVTILSSDELGEANGLLESIRQGLRVAGPLLGAAIYAAWGGATIAAIDAATFFGSAVFLAAMKVPEGIERKPQPFRRELRMGIGYIRRSPVLKIVMIVIGGALAAIGLLQVALFALVDEGLGREPEFIGVIATVQGAGSVIGGVLGGRRLRVMNEVTLLGMSLAAMGIGLAFLAIGNLAVVMIGVFIVGVSLAAHLVCYMTLIQRRTPNQLQGRVFSAAEAVLTVPYALSMALGIVLISHIDYRIIYVVNALVLLGTGWWLARWTEPAPPPPREEAPVLERTGEPVERVLDL